MKLPKGQSESVYRRTDNTMAKGKSTNGQTTIYRKGSSSCSTSDTRRVNLVTNRVISHEREKDREVFTTSGTYSCKVSLWIFNASFNNISVNGEFYLELRGGTGETGQNHWQALPHLSEYTSPRPGFELIILLCKCSAIQWRDEEKLSFDERVMLFVLH